MTVRLRLLCLLMFAFSLPSAPGRAQPAGELDVLWQQLMEEWSDHQFEAALEASNRLVEALEPDATDFTLGIQLNSALHNRASLRFQTGDFAGAEADLLLSVDQARGIQGPGGVPAMPQLTEMIDDRVRLSLRGLTNFYLAAGDLERATDSFQQALAIVPLWKKQAEGNPAIGYQVLAAEVSSLEGTFHRATGDYARAMEAFLNRVGEIDGAWESVLQMQGGQENDFSDQLKMNYLRGRANLLMEMAEVAVLQEKHAEAVGLCREARETATEMMPLYRKWAETVRQTNPGMAQETIEKTLEGVETNANYLIYERSALIFRAAGDEEGALEMMLEGMARRGENFGQQRMLTLEYNVIRPEESLKLIGDLQAILGQHEEAAASYAEAVSLTEDQYPEGHPAVLEIQESEALLAAAKGDAEAAEQIAREILAGRMRHLSDVLSFADEPQRLAYRSSIDPVSLPASLGLTDLLYETVLRSKGIVLESILEDRGLARRASDPELAEKLVELQTLQRRLMEALLAGGGGGEGRDLAPLRQRIGDLETDLREGTGVFGEARDSLTVSVEEVAAAIPEGAVLVEFIRYRDYSAPGRYVSRYGAVVLRAGDDPAFFPLAPASQVEQGMELYAEAIRAEAPDEEMTALLQAIGNFVWVPLAGELPQEGGRIILSPDGALSFLSFATLLSEDGRFVGEIWPVSYVSSGRDLLRESDSTREKSIEIIANPDFQSPEADSGNGNRQVGSEVAVSMRGVLSRIGLSPLPGTQFEEAAIRELVESDWSDWEIRSHLGADASEEAINAMRSPGILHLATHGFYLPRTGRADPFQRSQRYWDPYLAEQAAKALESFSDVVLDNPMHRSGVALAGAETTLGEWGAGRIPDTDRDGILTAEEMSQLNLDKTWLVVLSACESGLGEARSGEGVLGMRRGLMQAGAQHLLMTLWPVSDRETARFMLDFYRNLQAGERSPVDIATAVQGAYLKEFRENRGVTAAVKLAGPFILSYHP